MQISVISKSEAGAGRGRTAVNAACDLMQTLTDMHDVDHDQVLAVMVIFIDITSARMHMHA